VSVSYLLRRIAQRPANTFATFDVTGAAGLSTGTWRAASILPGDCGYTMTRSMWRTVRPYAAGAITTFDAVAGTGANQGRLPSASTRRKNRGYYVDAGNASHGFVRTAAASSRVQCYGAGAGANQEPLPPASTRRKNRGLFRRWNERESRFVRTAAGVITAFNVTERARAQSGTFAASIATGGTIADIRLTEAM